MHHELEIKAHIGQIVYAKYRTISQPETSIIAVTAVTLSFTF